MSGYAAPLEDIRFALEHIGGLGDLAALEPFKHAEPDLVSAVLDEGARFVQDLIAPLNRSGDVEGSTLVDGQVHTPSGFKEAYKAYVNAGWGGIDAPAEWGGHGMPRVVGVAFEEIFTSANLAFSNCPLLTAGGVNALTAHGTTEQQDRYLPKLITGEWSAAMNLTEPHAGSDVGALSMRAVPANDGTYRLTGTKIFITYGDHDMAANVVHLVLARVTGSPSGTRGISMFVVPKYLPDDNDEPGVANDVKVVSLEHKLGIKASPTCVMAFGEDSGGAVGFLLGGLNQGMRNMFTMMNTARISVAIQGMAVAERAYQQAAAFARERRQGRAVGAAETSPIVDHPDVRRMLLTMRSNTEAMRALLYRAAMHQDLAEHAGADRERRWHSNCLALLTPVVKTWCTDLGVEVASVGIQVHGGMGYIEETGAAQHWRDARITPIYEGTNGIQSIDLVMRKVPIDGGRFVTGYIESLRSPVAHLREIGWERAADSLSEALRALSDATSYLLSEADDPNQRLAGASPYCTMFGIVAGGAMMAEAAVAAHRTYESSKQVTSRFYLEQILPTAGGLLPAIKAGAADLFALDAASL
ncbi:MAG: acyl-CoA dehydrogenase [bacterium]|nr:acyl-CoA dehydrogenase [bacterium]